MIELGVRRIARKPSPHLLCRSGTYYLRVRVPVHLKARIGVSEIRRSLAVQHPRPAQALAIRYGTRVLEMFEMITRQPVTKAEARRLVADCFLDLRRDAELGFLPIAGRPDFERDEQRDLSRERINALQEQVNLKTFDAEIRTRALLLTARSGITFLDQPKGVQADIMEGRRPPDGRDAVVASTCLLTGEPLP